MEYIKESTGSYNLHTIKVDKFKNICMTIKFKAPFNEKEIVYRNFLDIILIEASKKYSSRRLLKLATIDLYNLKIYSNSTRRGKYSILSFSTSFLSEKYTEKGMFSKSIELLFELILNPYVKNNEFDKELFDVCKNILRDDIISSKDNPSRVAVLGLKKKMSPNMPCSYDDIGSLEELNKVTPKKLYDYYKKVIKTNIIDIFICGNIPSNTSSIIKDKFKVVNECIKSESHYIKESNFKDKYSIYKESKKVKQSVFTLGFKLKDMDMFEYRYVLPVYNYILGAGPSSKLFKEVREKNSLCYSISSNINQLDSIGLIIAGINKDNFDKVKELCLKLIDDMEKGKFSDDDIKEAIKCYLDGLYSVYDGVSSISNIYESVEYFDSDMPEVMKEKVKTVTKKMIVDVAKKIKVDTVFLLEGSLDNEKEIN